MRRHLVLLAPLLVLLPFFLGSRAIHARNASQSCGLIVPYVFNDVIFWMYSMLKVLRN